MGIKFTLTLKLLLRNTKPVPPDSTYDHHQPANTTPMPTVPRNPVQLAQQSTNRISTHHFPPLVLKSFAILPYHITRMNFPLLLNIPKIFKIRPTSTTFPTTPTTLQLTPAQNQGILLTVTASASSKLAHHTLTR